MTTESEKAYTGRWVARLRGKIIAQGGTPEQARLAALPRFKEKPQIDFIPDPAVENYPPLLDKISPALPKNESVYLVGGAVRDMLLNREVHDLDFTLAANGIKTARAVANSLKAKFFPLDDERDTGRVILDMDGRKIALDFASYRGTNLDTDLMGRDFTVNAIAFEVRSHQIFDPLGGKMDLKEMKLRSCSPSSIPDDPVRILRAIRLAADLGFEITTETRAGMKKYSSLLVEISPERVRDELFRILEGNKPTSCLRALDMLGALDYILPELSRMKGVTQPAPHQQDVWGHVLTLCKNLETMFEQLETGKTADRGDLQSDLLSMRIGTLREKINNHLGTELAGNRKRRGLLFLAALYHDAGKPATKKTDAEGQMHFWGHEVHGAEVAGTRARYFAMSNDEIRILETVIHNHMRFIFHVNRLVKDGKAPSRRAIYRFFRDSGSAGVELCLLGLADIRATYQETLPEETWAAAMEIAHLFLENWYEKPTESINPPPIVDGDDLMHACHLSPGPQVGELLEAIREAQATGMVKTREEAISLARGKFG